MSFMHNIKDVASRLKQFFNSFKIPRLVDFIFNPKKASDNAPKENWVRLGLGKISAIGLPVWFIILLPFVLAAFMYGSEALFRVLSFGRDVIVLIPFAVIVYFIYKSFKKKWKKT